MSKLIKIQNNFNDNLIENQLSYTVASGGANFTNSIDSFSFSKNEKSIFLNSNNTRPIVLNLGFSCEANNLGVQGFSFSTYKEDSNSFNIILRVFKNASLFQTFEVLNTDVKNNWNRYAQTFEGIKGDIFTFQLEISSDLASKSIFLSGFKFETLDKTNTMPSEYSYPVNNLSLRSDFLVTETQWDVADIGTQTIANGASLNLFTFINNATNKNVVNSDTYDQLNIVSNSIRTTYRNCKTIHVIRLSLNITSGSDQHYQLQIRRTIDDSVVYRALLQRNADETIQTIEMTTRTLSEIDPFVVDGFYLAFVNNSGASATIDDALSLVIISSYQKAQKV